MHMADGTQLILGRYRPLDILGSGGFSTVEVAWDTRIQRRVAIKRIPFDGNAPADSALTEARTAAMLNNPAIVQVYDFEETPSEALLIMEYMDGMSLNEYIRDCLDYLGPNEMAAIVTAVSQALQFAHDNGVLHLDIKPANIMINQRGEVKVGDFGMAQLEDVYGYLPADGGTVGYMPPEQISGGNMDGRTDEFALACVVYEMLTGVSPIRSSDVDGSLERIELRDYDAPSAFDSKIPKAIDDILYKALSPARSGRYPSVDDFADALLPYLGDPRQGIKTLAAVVSPQDHDFPPEQPRSRSTNEDGLWQRLGKRGNGILRASSALSCGWLTWLACSQLEIADGISWIVAMAIAAIGALAPQLGAILTFLTLGVICCIESAPICGAILLGTSIVWWLVWGRRDFASSALPLAAPLAGLTWLTPLFPFATGFRLDLRRFAPALVMGFIVLWVVCALTGSSDLMHSGLVLTQQPAAPSSPGLLLDTSDTRPDAILLQLIREPASIIMLLSWVFAASSASWLCGRWNRVLCIVSAILCGVLAIAGPLLLDYFQTGAWNVPPTAILISVGASLLLMLAVSIAGIPYRDEED